MEPHTQWEFPVHTTPGFAVFSKRIGNMEDQKDKYMMNSVGTDK